ncbi:MAG TPA: THxN family PEP-CTERM protein [Dissulfurispiraceae bacterium]|nr:THxN family PEP-CTERM protein [Dissulfurispiraceae bacterium]
MKKKLAALVTISLLLFGAGVPADAAYINQWDYTLYTVFDGTNTFTAGGGNKIQQLNQVSWGGSNSVFLPAVNSTVNRSGITIAQTAGANEDVIPVGGVVNTDDLSSIGQGHWITHHNKPISGNYATLTSSQIASTLTLKPAGMPVTPFSGTITFTIRFAETPNSVPCTATSPAGNPCNDIFALAGDNFNQTIVIDDFTYYVSIFPTAGPGIVAGTLPYLPDNVCTAAGAGVGCVGFTTVEGQNTSIRFGFLITSEPINVIPEPSTFVLIGAGLVGLGLAARRRMK